MKYFEIRVLRQAGVDTTSLVTSKKDHANDCSIATISYYVKL